MERWSTRLAFVAMAVVGMLGCNESANPLVTTPVSVANNPPVIHSFTVDPAEIESGGKVDVVATASDPEGQGLAFTFSAEHGRVTVDPSVLGRGTYQHDGSPGPATVAVTVSVTDSQGARVTADRSLGIKAPAPDPAPAQSPPDSAPPRLNLKGTPYFASGYSVGLSLSWTAVAGASRYRVTHFRRDACGEYTGVVYVTATASGSGLHPNCGATAGKCYEKTGTVEALTPSDGVIVTESVSICEIGSP